jgi:hypothetical protein
VLNPTLLKGFLIWLILISSFEIFSQPKTQTLSPDEVINLLPAKINGFRLNAEPQGKLIKLGTLQYCMAEKKFSASANRSVKILLFDYKQAPIMYSQATKKWMNYGVIESDSIIQRPVILTECVGWESNNAARKNSQILVGIYNRFYLTIEGTNVDLQFLRTVLQEFKIETFPK